MDVGKEREQERKLCLQDVGKGREQERKLCAGKVNALIVRLIHAAHPVPGLTLKIIPDDFFGEICLQAIGK